MSWIGHAEKIDKYKVRLITKDVLPAAIEYFAGPIAIHPNDYYEKVGPKGQNDKPVGSGPYRVASTRMAARSPSSATRIFQGFPKRRAQDRQGRIRFIPDRQTQLAEILSGGVDFLMHVPKDQADQIKTMAALQVVSGETMRIVFMQINSQDTSPFAMLKDVRVRRAINHAIDRERMVKSLVGEGSRVIHTICFPSQFGCTDEDAARYEYSPQKAKQLLAEAGLPTGFDIPFVAYRERQQSEALIGYLQAVGIKANLTFLQ